MAEDKRPLALQRDPYGENILVKKFDWRDAQIMAWIQKFPQFGQRDSRGNVTRQKAYRTGALLRSVYWRTWNASGGDLQVFEARYKYYAKFVELALGKGNPFRALPPGIPRSKWQPIEMPDRSRKAKPSIPTEMRRQAAKFTTMLEDKFLYHGLALIMYPLNNTFNDADYINRIMFQKRSMRATNML
jgi:hypothetical protein